jgi:hypothetical protein
MAPLSRRGTVRVRDQVKQAAAGSNKRPSEAEWEGGGGLRVRNAGVAWAWQAGVVHGLSDIQKMVTGRLFGRSSK